MDSFYGTVDRDAPVFMNGVRGKETGRALLYDLPPVPHAVHRNRHTIHLANCVVAGEANVGRMRRMRPNAKPRQMNATPNNATRPIDDAQEP